MAIKPHDILKDGADSAVFNGVDTRKGTIKAAIENAKIIESENASAQEKKEAKKAFKELIPYLIALELHEHTQWKNQELQKMIDDYLNLQVKK